ncbi:MAG: NIPSNAP family protein [Bryobacterales bacterium]|nr:NIPSNAP family protein [Bryobacterales bacterium]
MSTAAAAPARARYYVLDNYYLKNGSQGDRLAEYLRNGLIPAARRLEVPGPAIVLEALVAAHMPQVLTVTPYAAQEQIFATRASLRADSAWRKALAAWESGEEAPYESHAETLLEATDYSPALPAPEAERKTSRVFELRLYHSPTERQLKALHERFAGPEIPIFHRLGIHPLLYTSTLTGPHKPNLVYLTPFEGLSEREKAWNAFGADPEWIKVRKESIDKHGQIASVIQISLFRASAYSPIR